MAEGLALLRHLAPGMLGSPTSLAPTSHASLFSSFHEMLLLQDAPSLIF